jgi:hypothetical protein
MSATVKKPGQARVRKREQRCCPHIDGAYIKSNVWSARISLADLVS